MERTLILGTESLRLGGRNPPVLLVDPKTQNEVFVENGCNDFNEVTVIHLDHLFKQNNVGGFFRKITVRILGPQT
jgi:hypothetical protein